MKPTQNSTGKSTRRQFIRATATAAAAVAATPLFKRTVYGQATAPGRVIGANDRITVGFIGVGGQGMNAHVNLMTAHASANNVAQIAVCDVWTKRTDTAKTFIEGK